MDPLIQAAGVCLSPLTARRAASVLSWPDTRNTTCRANPRISGHRVNLPGRAAAPDGRGGVGRPRRDRWGAHALRREPPPPRGKATRYGRQAQSPAAARRVFPRGATRAGTRPWRSARNPRGLPVPASPRARWKLTGACDADQGASPGPYLRWTGGPLPAPSARRQKTTESEVRTGSARGRRIPAAIRAWVRRGDQASPARIMLARPCSSRASARTVRMKWRCLLCKGTRGSRRRRIRGGAFSGTGTALHAQDLEANTGSRERDPPRPGGSPRRKGSGRRPCPHRGRGSRPSCSRCPRRALPSRVVRRKPSRADRPMRGRLPPRAAEPGAQPGEEKTGLRRASRRRAAPPAADSKLRPHVRRDRTRAPPARAGPGPAARKNRTEGTAAAAIRHLPQRTQGRGSAPASGAGGIHEQLVDQPGGAAQRGAPTGAASRPGRRPARRRPEGHGSAGATRRRDPHPRRRRRHSMRTSSKQTPGCACRGNSGRSPRPPSAAPRAA